MTYIERVKLAKRIARQNLPYQICNFIFHFSLGGFIGYLVTVTGLNWWYLFAIPIVLLEQLLVRYIEIKLFLTKMDGS